MNKNEICVRQICMVFLALMPINKLIMLPSVLARYCEEQLYLPLIINFSFDVFVLFVFLRLSVRFPGKTFEEILTERFNARFAKAVYFLYGLFFLLKSFVPTLEQKYFVDNTLYDVFPNAIAFFPILIISTYASLKGKKILGRSADLSIWFTVTGLVMTFFFSIFSADYTNILPIFQKPGINTVIASFSTITWFSESLYMLLFLGHFKRENHTDLKIVLSYVGASVAVILFTVVFYSIFGKLSQTQIFAMTNMTVFTTKVINVGRFDYLASFMLLFSGVYSICLPIYAATKCFEHAFGFNKALIPAIAVNLVIAALLIFFENKYFSFLSFSKKYLNAFFAFMAYFLPLLFLIGIKRKKSEKI